VIAVGPVVRLRAGLDWMGAALGRQLDPDPLGTHARPSAVEPRS
jgi:uroporphyrin-III C-methyltransferase